ncbi:hypothetical protein Goe27_01630 [Bacillus phage vB_BsuM-Goe27]|nr:hypothetical protein Goe27_01630 [Bacillus phage vB_BsuM-Goe27]
MIKESPTPKQLQVIKYIEKNIDILFNGVTKSEAQAFINKHMDASREAARTFNAARIEERKEARYHLRRHCSAHYPLTDTDIERSNEKLRDSELQEVKSRVLGGMGNRQFIPYDDDEDDFRPF